MKTAERENRNRWADMISVCANGTAGQNRPCSSTWGWKQDKLQRSEEYLFLTSSSIELTEMVCVLLPSNLDRWGLGKLYSLPS
jgi:hypothetical protein